MCRGKAEVYPSRFFAKQEKSSNSQNAKEIIGRREYPPGFISDDMNAQEAYGDDYSISTLGVSIFAKCHKI